MKNIVFVIWIIGWSLACAIEAYIFEVLLKREYTDGLRALSAVFNILIWILVGKALYQQ